MKSFKENTALNYSFYGFDPKDRESFQTKILLSLLLLLLLLLSLL